MRLQAAPEDGTIYMFSFVYLSGYAEPSLVVQGRFFYFELKFT